MRKNWFCVWGIAWMVVALSIGITNRYEEMHQTALREVTVMLLQGLFLVAGSVMYVVGRYLGDPKQ